jgi:hypothetical protein
MRLFGTISTKNTLAFVLLMVACIHSYSQKTFSTSISPLVNLTNSNGTCANNGTLGADYFVIPVSTVGTASPNNQLLLVSIELNNDCYAAPKPTVTLDKIGIRVMSPSGQCVAVYGGTAGGGLSASARGTHFINLVSSNYVPSNCLNYPLDNSANAAGSGVLNTGNNGYFKTQYDGTATAYNYTGSLDGNWRIIFSENSSGDVACLKSIRLVFGNPTITAQVNTGQTCATALVWDGTSPICTATLSTATGSNEMPGSITGPGTNDFGTIGGQVCEWNNANNNDIWIKYTATTSFTCLTISGLDNQLQSIVVTDANTNDTDPCTQIPKTSTNDPNWTVASCPRPSIYATTSGTEMNQQHCFSSIVGRDYFLVVDGNAGAASPFMVWGSKSATLPGLLPANSFDLTGLRSGNANVLEWLCTSDKPVVAYFVQRSYDRTDFQPIARLEGMQTGTSKRQFKDPLSLRENYYYRIKAELADGMFIYSNIIQLRGGSQNSITAFPNPVKDVLHVSTPNKIDHINIFNAQGQLIFTEIRSGLQSIRIPTISWEPGQYILVVTDMQGNTETMKVVK